MSFQKLLTTYVNTSCSANFTSKAEYVSSSFVSHFENFVHVETAKVINASKSAQSTFTNTGRNDFQDEEVDSIEHASIFTSSKKSDLKRNRKNNFADLEHRITGKCKNRTVIGNEEKCSAFVTASQKTINNSNSNRRIKSSASVMERKQSSRETKFAAFKVSPNANRTQFDIACSNDFPDLSTKSLATDLKFRGPTHKHTSRRIKPTMISVKTKSTKISSMTSQKSNSNEVSSLISEQNNSHRNISAKISAVVSQKTYSNEVFNFENPPNSDSLPSNTNVDPVATSKDGTGVHYFPRQKSFSSPLTHVTSNSVNVSGPENTKNKKSTPTCNGKDFGCQKNSGQLTPDSFLQLQRLADMHSYFLNHYLVTSIILEIHMLLTMLVLEPGTHDSDLVDGGDRLASILNSTEKTRLFAALCLVNLSRFGFFGLFSTEMLNLMISHVENESSLMALTNAIKKELEVRATLQQREDNPQFLEGKSRTSVPFKPDTDNRSNFSSDKAFFGFRKQRDMFYCLLRQWDKNQSSEKVSKEAIGQIRWLINQVKNLSTFDAFLRLFLDHLLSIGGSADSVSHSTNDNFPLVSLLNGDSEKFRRLESRVTKAMPSQKSNSCDWMYREFQFFRDFVTIADSYTFNVHLCDYLHTRICEIEKENFQIDTAADDETSQDYSCVIQAIYDLRILGNFYGLVVFQPFQNGGKRSNLSHIEKTCGEFLLSSLNRALCDGHLLLTVPWVVQFLHFSFSVLTTSELFSKIAILLQCIYRLKETSLSSHNIPQMLSLFTGTVICTLFEQEFYSHDFFYQHLDSNEKVHYQCSSNSVDSMSDSILSSRIIGEMHWRLADIRTLLKCKTSLNKRQLPKKITPSSEKLPDSSNMQAKLEAAFFRNQPLSLKRTVSFVSDRCHSNCVKHLCSDVLPRFCRESKQLKKFVEEKSDAKDPQVIKIAAQEMYKEAIDYLREQASQFVEDSTAQCMNVLVSSAVSKPVLQTATLISGRMAVNNVETWLNARLLDHLVSNLKLLLIAGQNQPNSSENESITERPFLASRVIHNLRETVINNQKFAGNCNEVIEAAKNQLSVVSQLLVSYQEAGDNLPRHVLAALSYLVKELICTCTPSSADYVGFIDGLELKNCQKAIMHKIVLDFS